MTAIIKINEKSQSGTLYARVKKALTKPKNSKEQGAKTKIMTQEDTNQAPKPKRRSRIFRSKNPKPISMTKRRLDELEILYKGRIKHLDEILHRISS